MKKEKSLTNVYKGKKILITGHTGFKGAWLTQILLNLGAKVCGYSLAPNTDPNIFSALELRKEIEHHIGDLKDLKKLNRIVKKFKPDIIFHLAAQPLVRDSYDDPRYTYEANVMGTVNILECIRLNQIKAGVIITTDKVYKNIEQNIAYKEDDKLGGHDPYSNSKACADLVVDSYIKSFFNLKEYNITHQTLIASARAGNVIGGGDWAKDRLVPDAIRAFLASNKPLTIRNPKAVRPWQHVFEPLNGYLLLGAALLDQETDKVGSWNFGPAGKDTKSVETVLKILLKEIKQGSYIIEKDTSKHEAKLLKLDSTKAKKQLKWQSKYDLNGAVKTTARWYKKYYDDKSEIKKLTIDQIKQYFFK